MSPGTRAAWRTLRLQIRGMLQLDVTKNSAQGETELGVRRVATELLGVCPEFDRAKLRDGDFLEWLTQDVVQDVLAGREHPNVAELRAALPPVAEVVGKGAGKVATKHLNTRGFEKWFVGLEKEKWKVAAERERERHPIKYGGGTLYTAMKRLAWAHWQSAVPAAVKNEFIMNAQLSERGQLRDRRGFVARGLDEGAACDVRVVAEPPVTPVKDRSGKKRLQELAHALESAVKEWGVEPRFQRDADPRELLVKVARGCGSRYNKQLIATAMSRRAGRACFHDGDLAIALPNRPGRQRGSVRGRACRTRTSASCSSSTRRRAAGGATAGTRRSRRARSPSLRAWTTPRRRRCTATPRWSAD